MEVASLHDLLGHKLKLLLQRVEAKDYLDIDAILAAGHDLATGLAGAQVLFREFAAQEALKALTYFDAGDVRLLSWSARQRLIAAASAVREIPEARILSPELSALVPDSGALPGDDAQRT
jgi:hypothetical protein